MKNQEFKAERTKYQVLPNLGSCCRELWGSNLQVFAHACAASFSIYSSKILQYKLSLHPTILSNYYTNNTNTTETGPQGAKDNDYPVAADSALSATP